MRQKKERTKNICPTVGTPTDTAHATHQRRKETKKGHTQKKRANLNFAKHTNSLSENQLHKTHLTKKQTNKAHQKEK